MAVGHPVHPNVASSPAELVQQMRRLKDWSGLTYRQISARAQDAGDCLPSSTAAGALARRTLPREELLAAFVRACTRDEQAVRSWTRERAAVAERARYGPPVERPPVVGDRPPVGDRLTASDRLTAAGRETTGAPAAGRREDVRGDVQAEARGEGVRGDVTGDPRDEGRGEGRGDVRGEVREEARGGADSRAGRPWSRPLLAVAHSTVRACGWLRARLPGSPRGRGHAGHPVRAASSAAPPAPTRPVATSASRPSNRRTSRLPSTPMRDGR